MTGNVSDAPTKNAPNHGLKPEIYMVVLFIYFITTVSIVYVSYTFIFPYINPISSVLWTASALFLLWLGFTKIQGKKEKATHAFATLIDYIVWREKPYKDYQDGDGFDNSLAIVLFCFGVLFWPLFPAYWLMCILTGNLPYWMKAKPPNE